MDPQAPPVVAVVVTADDWPGLGVTLTSLAQQDYPSLSVLVIDAASPADPTPRVASVMPSAYVRRLPAPAGFAEAANQCLEVVEGGAFFLLCHDDVALDPDAVRVMVEEAFRSNAGIVCPKLVDWDDPSRLQQVGMAADKGGVVHPFVTPGEIDQEQHDAVRDVFVAPGAATLVRVDLFRALGGFDPAIELMGEDVDLCWRAQVAGARVVVAPGARARHQAALSSGLRPVPVLPGVPTGPEALLTLRRRHELRSSLKCYGRWHLVRVLPHLAFHSLVEGGVALAGGHAARARAALGAWRWNLSLAGDLRRRRREVAASRLLPDSEVRRLQVSTSSRLVGMAESVWSERVHLPTAVPGATRAEPGVAWRTGLAWVVMGLVMLIGSRDLFHAGLPAVGSVPLFPSAGDLLGRFTTGWRDTGLGQVTPAPLAFALLGVAGTLLGGSMGLLRDVLTFGMVPLGAIGVWRMARPLGMSEARLVATAVYLAVPLPYDSIANGRWGPLLAYGASPWLLSPLLRSCRRPPFPASSLVLGLLGTGLGLAVTAALVPGEAVALLVAGVGLGVGSLLVGGARALPEAARPVVLAALAGSAAWLLDLPWSLAQVAPGANGGAVLGVPVGVDRAAGVGSLLGLVGRHGATSWVGWCLLVPAALPLLLGRGWRLEWAARLWWVAMACWAAAWAGGRGWFGAPMPDAGVLVAVAAAALAASAGLGVVVFRTDLAGYHFGWRQVSAGLAALGALAAALATVGAAAGGRWGAATTDFSGEVASLGHDARSAGGYRMLWAGEPSAVPVPGWQLQPGFTYATSYDGYPDASAWWPGPDPGAITRAGAALLAAEQSRTVELGHLLAPMGVRYVVVPLAPSPGSSHRAPPPPGLLAGLNAQRDLRPVDLDPLLAVYEDVAWAPTRATLPAPALAAARRSGPSGGLAVDLSTTTPALTDRTGASSFGGVVAPAGLFWSASPAGWSLSEGGSAPVRGRPAFGWATVFPVVGSSSARLVFDTGAGRPVQLAVEGLLWAATIAAVLAGRRRRRRVAVVE